MAIAIRCPKCKKKLAVPEGSSERRFRCKCGAVLKVGGASAADAAPPPPPVREAPAASAPPPPAKRRPRPRSAARRGSSTGLYAGLGIAAAVAAAAGFLFTRGPSSPRRRRSSSGRVNAETTDSRTAASEPEGASGSDAASDVPVSAPAADERPASRAAASREAATPADDGPASAEPAPAVATAPPPETAAPVEPIPVETSEFTPPQMPSAVETAPVKWPGAKAKGYLSPVDVVADPSGKMLYVAQRTANRVAAFAVAGGGTGKIWPVGGPPGRLAMSPDGKRLFVPCSIPEGVVEILDAEKGSKLGSVRVGHTPVAVAVSPDGRTLYVCNRFSNDVSVVDLASKRETKRIKVLREPMSAALTPDGRVLFVANHLPVGRGDADVVAASVSVIDTAAGKLRTNIRLSNGATDLSDVCVSPDGRYAYAVHILARFQVPTTQVERGWMNTNALSVIDVATQKLTNAVLLDDPDLGAANPWSVTCTADGRFICVSHAGTNELSVIDSGAFHAKLASATGYAVANDLYFMDGIRRRIPLPGEGPRGLAAVGMTVFVTQYFSDDLAAVNLEAKPGRKLAGAVSLGPTRALTEARRGEILFHSGTACFQQWQSCVSCHPDARADGLNWDLLNDAMGNPRSAKSMLLAHRTPPVMITGVRASAEVAVRAGIRFIQFAQKPEKDAVAIDTYLKALEPVPSPYLVDGKLSAAAQRGKRIFAKADCGSCHSGPYFTDRQKHDVGTGLPSERDIEFDTPTLVEVWRTAPYLFDGRAATMLDVFQKHNKDDSHGTTQDLKEQELKDMVEFVLSQ